MIVLAYTAFKKRLHSYAVLMRLDKPIGFFLLLWPTLWALWLAARGVPDIKILSLFCLGVFIMRAAGCAINDYADRHLDGQVSRTCQRPLVTGLIEPWEALLVFIVLALLAFLVVLQFNGLTVFLSLIAIVLATFYPFTKRFTHLPQLFLGAAFGWSVPMAFAALGHPLNSTCWLLFLATLIWTLMYDTLYAMVDRADDITANIKSSAIMFAHKDRLIVAFLQCLTLLLLLWIGAQEKLGLAYFIGLIMACVLFFHQVILIKDRQAQPCFRAFLNNNYVGLSIFFGLFVDLL